MTSGRKREFDAEIALEAAMQVFWQKGYTGASLTDLIDSMGINKPSMYRAFGNKEALFVKALKQTRARRRWGGRVGIGGTFFFFCFSKARIRFFLFLTR